MEIQPILTIEALLQALEIIAAENNKNAPCLVLFCDLSYQLSEAEDQAEIMHGTNILADIPEILATYSYYSRNYQWFELGKVTQAGLAREARLDTRAEFTKATREAMKT